MPTAWQVAGVVDRSERADLFVHSVSESLVPYGSPAGIVLADDDGISSTDVGMLRILRVRWSGGSAVRSAAEIRRSDPEFCKIDVPFAGRFDLEQHDRQAAIGAGAFTFVDLSRPHRIAAERTELNVVMFPRALLPLRDKDIDRLAGATFDRAQPGGALVTSVVREMVGNLPAYEGQCGARIGASVLDLIFATLAARLDRTTAVPAESRRRVLVMRIRAFVEEHLGDPDLAPPVVAARHHISLRLLHRLFQDEGTTVAGLIRARRLARCRHDLLDPAKATTPVNAIAARWGLRDAAYFNRVFQAEYGLPPGQYRQLTADGACANASSAWAAARSS